MIAKLTGIVDSLGDGWAIIDVAGVGYLVSCPSRTLARLIVGEPARLHVETHVREDSIQLFAFGEAADRHWFRLLLGVQGVGPKVAIALLSVASADELLSSITTGDRGLLSRATGVGPRLATRIIGELRDKVAAVTAIGEAPYTTAADVGRGGQGADAISALVNLGFRPAEAAAAIAAVSVRLGPDGGVEALIRGGLAELASQGGDQGGKQ